MNLCVSYTWTLTPQNTLLEKSGGSKKPQKRSQTLLVHPLVSTPINTWLLPVRRSDTHWIRWQDKQEHESVNIMSCYLSVFKTLSETHWEGREGQRGTFTQQLNQLLFGESVDNEAQDEEGGEENAQSSAQEGVQTCCFFIRHISPACAHGGNLDLIFTVRHCITSLAWFNHLCHVRVD